MLRKVNLQSPSAVAAYGFCEDLLRITTPEEEGYRMAQHLPESLRGRVTKLLKSRHEASALRDLEATVRLHDFEEAEVPVKLVHYCWEGGRLTKDDIECSELGLWPIVNVLSMDSEYFIMYTSQMNYVDGYDPFSGEDFYPIIPEDMIKSVRQAIRHQVIHRPRESHTGRITRDSVRSSPRVEALDEPQEIVVERTSQRQAAKVEAVSPLVVENPTTSSREVPRSKAAKPQPPPVKKTAELPFMTKGEERSSREDTEEEVEDWRVTANDLAQRGKTRERCVDCALI
jgi:hypothetical protein